jgi:hypothetical protein
MAVKTSNLTWHSPARLYSGDVLYFLGGTNWILVSQKTAFVIVMAVKTSNLTTIVTYFDIKYDVRHISTKSDGSGGLEIKSAVRRGIPSSGI